MGFLDRLLDYGKRAMDRLDTEVRIATGNNYITTADNPNAKVDKGFHSIWSPQIDGVEADVMCREFSRYAKGNGEFNIEEFKRDAIHDTETMGKLFDWAYNNRAECEKLFGIKSFELTRLLMCMMIIGYFGTDVSFDAFKSEHACYSRVKEIIELSKLPRKVFNDVEKLLKDQCSDNTKDGTKVLNDFMKKYKMEALDEFPYAHN